MDFLTDLATERAPKTSSPNVTVECDVGRNGIKTTTVRILNETGEREAGRPVGNYYTVETDSLAALNMRGRLALAFKLSQILIPLIKGKKNILVAGLGNRNMTADSLGALAADRILVNRHEPDGAEVLLSAVIPGVTGLTGLEAFDTIKGVVGRISPDAVIAIDSLASRKADRISSAFQITDTGIVPGGGVGNHRLGLSEETLGIPVIAVGVPLVVYASAISIDAVDEIIKKYPQAAIPDVEYNKIVSELSTDYLRGLVVTPRDIDVLARDCAYLIALAINSAVLRIPLKELAERMR